MRGEIAAVLRRQIISIPLRVGQAISMFVDASWREQRMAAATVVTAVLAAATSWYWIGAPMGNPVDRATYLDTSDSTANLQARCEISEKQSSLHVLSADEERALKPKDEFQECETCPRMVVIPAGKFLMGSPPDEKDRMDNEGPLHEVTLSRPFAVGKFEVTFAEWDACVAGGSCRFWANPWDSGWGRDRQPVIDVTWYNAKDYVAWLSKKTGKQYRLLSEAEWEYAARANSATRFHFGDDDSDLGQYAWYRQNSNSRPHPVGQKRPNAFGLFDMHGNVEEWLEDCASANYLGAPIDGAARTDRQSCGHVLRGGSWAHAARHLRVADRVAAPSDERNSAIGFRVARTLDVAPSEPVEAEPDRLPN